MPQLRELAALLREEILREVPAAQKIREHLHANPCLSGAEGPAAEYLSQQVPVELEPVAETGRIGRLGPGRGPAVAVRAELDALPVTENTGASFASKTGAMHACGHDIHQAAWVSLVRAAAKIPLPVALVPFLQPREETYPSGAQEIVASEAFLKHDVSAVFAAHVHPGVAPNAVAAGAGAINAAADEVHIKITGTPGHGAYPHLAANPIPALGEIAGTAAAVVRQAVSPMEPVVFSVGKLSGGESANVIPESAYLSGTLRTMSAESRRRAHETLREFVRRTADAYGVTAEVNIITGEPVLVNDRDYAGLLATELSQSGLQEAPPLRSCGADDFAFFTEKVPGIMAFVGVAQEKQPPPSLHHPEFLPDSDSVRRVALALGVGYIAGCRLIAGENG